MNPNQLTDQLGLFLDVLESGSFSAASRRHPLTPSAVARRIDSLESAVGSQLFIRSTHAIRATPAGLAFAERARRIVAELQLARAEAVSLSSAPEGLIRIDAPAAFGRRHLAPVIADFLVLYPGLDVQLHLIDSFVDMHGSNLGKVDLVLRAGQLADTRLVATPLASMVRIACASPDYLKRRGVPNHPAQLSEHDGLDWDGLAPPFAWRFEQDGQMQLHRPARIRMSANNAEALVCGALAGLGIAPADVAGQRISAARRTAAAVLRKRPAATREHRHLRLAHGAADKLAQPFVAGVPQDPLQPGATMGSGAATGFRQTLTSGKLSGALNIRTLDS
ncbi:HTH-type transcriptional regulator DmlR [Pseudomonas fluorescens]|nr:HTH-type transcriptional regulator DmlR [Pseudomonas fluorescens]